MADPPPSAQRWAMPRTMAMLLVLVLFAGVPAPAAASLARTAASTTGPMPPMTSVMRPVQTAAIMPSSLRRLGTLRISGIGLSVSVYEWGCGTSIVPDYALRWGCVTTRNRFIVGHAYGVFKPYYRAYVAHTLKRGMIATFTDRYGTVTKYRLSWVRLVPKTYLWNGLTGEQWAWNATLRKALTLQTCWGSTNLYRIITRFDQV